MSIAESLKQRRTYYAIDENAPISDERIVAIVEEMTELVPDAFNMKSARAVVVLGEKNKQLWDTIHDAFGGKVPREKIDGFAAGRGTVLYYIDTETVERLQGQFPSYAANFPGWALQANGMLQLSVWTALREQGVGASLQHYNPVIDAAVRELLDLPETFQLVAQMPFGGIVAEPAAKEPEDISLRVFVKE